MNTRLGVFCEKIIEAGWLAALVAVPVFFNIYTARTFEPDKITLLRSIAMLMSLAWIIWVIERGRIDMGDAPLADHFRRWLKAPLFLPTALLVLIYLISTIFSISPKVSLWGSYQRLQGTYSSLSYIIIFAIMAGTLRTREQVERLVTIVIVTSVPVSLYGIVQRYGLDPLPWAGDVTERVASTLGNAIFVASYLIMAMPLTIVRLVESMTAIVKEETASWGHTILAAVYIFVLAIQTLTVVFSQSRGPMIGILGATFVMGLLIILMLRQGDDNPARLSIKEAASGITFVPLLLLMGAVGGAIGFFLGLGLENLLLSLNYQLDSVSLLGGLLGGLLGFIGTYTYMGASGKGWRWLWLSWLGVAAAAILFMLALNLRNTGFDLYLDPVRELPGLDRLSKITGTESGTGRVRVLIWDAAMNLVIPHDPLGIRNDTIVPEDSFNLIRPLIGYGPESMFNAFAYVYPPELAHVENRGSSADRSHNETVDSLVITGVLGFLIFYFLMIQIFYYGISWLGWAPDQASKRRLAGLLVFFSLAGGAIAYLADGDLTFLPIGFPFGLIAGMIAHLIWQGFIEQKQSSKVVDMSHALLLIGILGAFIGHFIEVHFVFSIAATYTYFWIYAGLMVALSRMNILKSAASEEAINSETVAEESPEPEWVAQRSPKRTKKGRARRIKQQKRSSGLNGVSSGKESWEILIGSQGLAMAIILIIITFDFITPQFEFTLGDSDSMSLLWMYVITWLIGFAISLSLIAIRQDSWRTPVNWFRAVMLYSVSSLFYFFFYYIAHGLQFGQRVTINTASDVITAANVLTNGLVVFYIFLFILMILFAFMLSWRQMRRQAFWRAENWWLYPPLVLAILSIIWFKNIDVVRADIYLKEGDRYRSQQQWDQAIILHERARDIDSDEDFYYLMLALDYQLMAQDGRLDENTRTVAWNRGEEIALEARAINPYNPDNTGNMGRYYFTIGQIFNGERFNDALDFFEKATVLAPSNVIYHNLWAQTHYIMQDYEKAVERLEISAEIDPMYPPTWILLGDTHAAMGNVDKALIAHTEGMTYVVRGSDGLTVFADQFLDQRLNFYVSAGRVDDIVSTMQELLEVRPGNPLLLNAIARAYTLAGRQDEAIPYLEQSLSTGNTSPQSAQQLADLYLADNALEQALPLYEFVAQQAPNVQVNSALAFIYAQQGRVDEAIQQNQLVLQQLPDDYDSLKNLAILYQQNGQWSEALDSAQRAQQVSPEADRPSWDPFIADIEAQVANASSNQ